jgi:hypothetical protein
MVVTNTDDSIANSDNPIEEVFEDDAREAQRGRYGWFSLTIAAIFGLFYAYNVWQGISNLVALPAFYDAFGYGAENVPWWLLWIGVLIPIAGFLAAFAIGRKHNAGEKALIFLVGLAVVAALSIGISGLEDILRPAVSA